jgi:hypothetical protein
VHWSPPPPIGRPWRISLPCRVGCRFLVLAHRSPGATDRDILNLFGLVEDRSGGAAAVSTLSCVGSGTPLRQGVD